MSNEEDQDLVDYDEEEEEQNVAAEETADAEGKETKKWVNNCKKTRNANATPHVVEPTH